jgi:nucleotide-binding universal stress UspA family protein
MLADMTSATPPFPRVLVPYDGSEPARAALTLALALGQGGATLVLITIVDETAVIADATSTVVYDPTTMLDELDTAGQALLDEAAAVCSTAGIVPVTDTARATPVAGILAGAHAHACDLIVMGTHARTGVERLFLGSTTAGVLRSSRVPVLTVRTADRIDPVVFARVVVAVDDSDPSDAAAAVAAKLAREAGASVTAVSVVDPRPLYASASDIGFDVGELERELGTETEASMRAAIARAGLPGSTAVVVAEGVPPDAIVATADERAATVIVCGTHGRRGVRRLLLGSVAEHLVRTSDVPVLVVPVHVPS